MSIRTYGDPVLRAKAEPVTDFDEELERTVEGMARTMLGANGVGLAANQVGIARAFFVAKLTPNDGIVAFVNPEVIPLSAETEEDEEGCLSIPGVWVEVKRHLKVRLRAQDIKGNPIELELEGHPARVVQHEVDHLNGVLIIDRITPAQRRRIAEQLEELKARV